MKQSDIIKFNEVLNKDTKNKSHVVLDLTYTIDEGQEVFSGSHEECEKFISEQGGSCTSMYDIVPTLKTVNVSNI